MLAVLDSNILVAALMSRRGASNELLRRVAGGELEIAVSTALVLEYDDVLHRPGLIPDYSHGEIDDFLDSICAVAREAFIYFRWRPFLPDPGDDLVFECALAAGASHLVTHNLKDFPDLDRFGLSVVTPGDILQNLSA